MRFRSAGRFGLVRVRLVWVGEELKIGCPRACGFESRPRHSSSAAEPHSVPTKQLVVGGEGSAQTTRRRPAADAGSKSTSIRLTWAMWTASDAPKPAAELPLPTDNPAAGATAAEMPATNAAAVFTARAPGGVAALPVASPAAAKEPAEPEGVAVRAVFGGAPGPSQPEASPRGRSRSSSVRVVLSKRPRAQERGRRSRPQFGSAERVQPVRRETPGASVSAWAQSRTVS